MFRILERTTETPQTGFWGLFVTDQGNACFPIEGYAAALAAWKSKCYLWARSDNADELHTLAQQLQGERVAISDTLIVKVNHHFVAVASMYLDSK